MRLKLTKFRPWRFLWENLRDPLTWQAGASARAPLWLRGFTSEHILLFGLDQSNWQDYPRDALRHRVTLRTNRHVWPMLHDKLSFDGLCKGRLSHVEALFFVVEGRFQSLPKGMDKAAFLEAVSAGLPFVLKPAQGGMGSGLIFIKTSAEGLRVNGKASSIREVENLLSRLEYHLCYPFVEQHEAMRQCHPESVNTLRVGIYVNQDGRPVLLTPVLRVGTSQSAPIDNFCKGGLLVEIDEASGCCQRALRRSQDGKVEWIERHPESGAALTGWVVPFWQEVRRDLLAFHADQPSFDLVGWDVLIAPSGYFVIEGNHNPDLRLHLLFRNLAEDAGFRAFLSNRGLV